jgi:hypothetical protein
MNISHIKAHIFLLKEKPSTADKIYSTSSAAASSYLRIYSEKKCSAESSFTKPFFDQNSNGRSTTLNGIRFNLLYILK